MTGARAHAEDERVDVPPFDLARLRSELAASVAPRYEVLKQLGGGGMGTVFLAREPALKRLVAIKVLAPSLAADQTAVARFEREARMAAAGHDWVRQRFDPEGVLRQTLQVYDEILGQRAVRAAA